MTTFTKSLMTTLLEVINANKIKKNCGQQPITQIIDPKPKPHPWSLPLNLQDKHNLLTIFNDLAWWHTSSPLILTSDWNHELAEWWTLRIQILIHALPQHFDMHVTKACWIARMFKFWHLRSASLMTPWILDWTQMPAQKAQALDGCPEHQEEGCKYPLRETKGMLDSREREREATRAQRVGELRSRAQCIPSSAVNLCEQRMYAHEGKSSGRRDGIPMLSAIIGQDVELDNELDAQVHVHRRCHSLVPKSIIDSLHACVDLEKTFRVAFNHWIRERNDSGVLLNI